MQSGRQIGVGGASVYVEESGGGGGWVVFEAGLGFGRTSWDRVVTVLGDSARCVTYDRVGHGRSERGRGPTSLAAMATVLLGVVDAVVPGPLVLVAHSMGALIAREVAPSLGSRLAGLVLVDPTPETAAMFDDVTRLTRRQDRMYAMFELASRVPPLRRAVAAVGTGSFRGSFAPETYATMLAEDVLPASFAQMRREAAARAAAVVQFRRHPPQPPECPVIVLSANRTVRGAGGYLADIQEHQRRYVETVPHGSLELVDAAHVLQAEQPDVVATHVRALLPVS